MHLMLRQYLLPLHRWTGLTIGLVIVLMALTGSATLFRPALEPVLHPEVQTVANCAARVALDTLTANAVAAHPGVGLDSIRILAGTDTQARMPAAMVRFADQTLVYLDPCSGRVLGQGHRFSGVMGTIEQVHRFRFMEHGSLVTGTSALLFAIVMVLGGLCLWLPATLRGANHALRLNLSLTGQARRLNLHKTVGLYAGLVVLASALTGLPQAFEWYANGLYALTGSSLPVKPAPRISAAPRLPLETLWRRAQLLVPRPIEAQLRYDGGPGAAVEIFLIARDAPHANARTLLFLDPYTGATVSFTPYARSSVGHKLYFWALSWHTGQIGGWFGQLILLAGALCVPLLAYTGISSYLRRKTRTPDRGRLALRVLRKTWETDDICSFELGAANGGPLPPFAAGAHIEVYIGGGLVREYSLCNDPGQTQRYLIGVLRDPNSRGGSRALHEKISEGDLLETGWPKNHFPLDGAAARSLLLAGGIGITPILSMAEHLSRVGAEFSVHYSTLSRARTAFQQRIAASPYASRVAFHFSDGAPEQLLDLAALLKGAAPDTHLYICGPIGFMTVAIDTARELGWPAQRMHKEYFAAEVAKSERDVAFDVTVASSGRVYRIGRDQTVLAVLSSNGVKVPSACEQGVCGTCITRVLAGKPEHRDRYLTAEEHARNDQFAPCCSRACGSMLVLDL